VASSSSSSCQHVLEAFGLEAFGLETFDVCLEAFGLGC
jgi:hypothetical protein